MHTIHVIATTDEGTRRALMEAQRLSEAFVGRRIVVLVPHQVSYATPSIDPAEAPAIIELPAELERWQQENAQEIKKEQARMREEFTKWFAKGYAAVGLRAGAGNRAYLLTPWSDF